MKNLTKNEINMISGGGNISLSCVGTKTLLFGTKITQKINEEFSNIKELEEFLYKTKKTYGDLEVSCDISFNNAPYNKDFPNLKMQGSSQIQGTL